MAVCGGREQIVMLAEMQRIQTKHPNAEFGLNRHNHGEGIAIGHVLNNAFLDALGVLACGGGSG